MKSAFDDHSAGERHIARTDAEITGHGVISGFRAI
jgi:hypothetical protein